MALELVGGALLSGLFQSLFERMASREVLDFFQAKKLNNKVLKKLKIMLLSANAVLNSAEEMQTRNPTVKDWLDELKETTNELEDLMDEIRTETLSAKLKCDESGSSRSSKQVLSLISTSFTVEIDPKMEEIMDRLELLLSQKDVLGLKEGGLNKPSRTFPSPLVEESDIYGRSHDKDVIIKFLLSDDRVCGDKISVISIVGMGGIGKTTLAQLVFDDDRVKGHFDIKVWVSVSDDFDVYKITKTIFDKTLFQSSETVDHIPDIEVLYGAMDLHQLQVKLNKALEEKRFLFVFDDIWNENYDDWDVLRSPFGSGAHGSTIVTTTRSEIAASRMRSVPNYHLQTISSDDCWLLFVKHAFNNIDIGAHPELEKIGRQIVKKCNGLPLAVKSLGGLLRSELNPKKWENILKSDIWEFSSRECNVLPALWLSYHYLPPHLKRCFAYCSIFPKTFELAKENVILLWMAEDLLPPQKGKRIEDVGEECFDTLVSRSLLQQSSYKGSFFIMHDLVNDLARFVSGKFCFRLEYDDPFSAGSNCIHHLSYAKQNIIGAMAMLISAEVKSLRTFLPLGSLEMGASLLWNKSVLDGLFPRVRYLRVLSLSQYPIMDLPSSIGDLRHLRYLNLSSTRLEVIPDEICTLYNLQTLLLLGCRRLMKLPACMGSLINLRHLDTRNTKLKEMPAGMRHMKDLQTLTNVVLGKQSASNIKDLKGLRYIRGGLVISGVDNIIDVKDAVEANLKDKEYLTELSLLSFGFADNSRKEMEILDALQPHGNLKNLHIQGYKGTRFPNWMGHHSFSNMVALSLDGCVYCCSLPPLGQLPELRKLYIIRFSMVQSIGDEFYSSGSLVLKPFRSLEKLVFRHMPQWQEWSFPENSDGSVFPCLEELHLEYCPRLVGGLPDRKIETLVVTHCEKLTVP